MNKTSKQVWMIATILFAIAITTFTLTPMVMHPWNVIPYITGDGGKNIFTYLYHALYGKGIWFTGMNYPYGEHIVFAADQPLLSVTLNSFTNSTPGQALALMGWLISLSYIIAISYIYKILSHFGVKPFIALFFAGLIGIFTPQLMRIQGHYGLSYSCIMPMLFFWTIRYNENPQWKYPFYIFILGCFFTFLHPYFAAFILIWVIAYAVGCFIFTKNTFTEWIKHVLPILFSAISVLALFVLMMKLTDPAKDRPVSPLGMLENCTTANQIFTSYFSPVWRYVKDHTKYTGVSESGEGYNYVGIVTIAVLLFSLVMGIINKLNKNENNNIVSNRRFSPIWLFIAITTLLFSMGVPFIWHMEWLLDYVSLLRQFRTLGRFGWIFYYVIAVYSVVVINTWYVHYIRKKKTVTGYLIILTTMAIWSYEASGYVLHEKKDLDNAADNIAIISPPGKITWPGFLKEHHFVSGDFQALLIFPFFEIGTEKLSMGDDFNGLNTFGISIYAALQLHLPMIDAMMSRTSWSIAEKQVKIIAGPYVHKPILDEIKNDKPFLLLQYEGDSLTIDQKYLLTASDYIDHFQSCYIYACYPSRLRANDKKNADSINAITPYIKPGNDSSIRGSGTWYINHFDSGTATQLLFSNGAIPQIPEVETTIANIPVKPGYDNQLYEFSCWFLLSKYDPYCPYYNIQLLDSSGNKIKEMNGFVKHSTDNYGLWFRSNVFFTIPASCSQLKCRLFNYNKKCYQILDEIMLRPAEALIISKDANENIMVNNHLFKSHSEH